jgi:hypothetical protein
MRADKRAVLGVLADTLAYLHTVDHSMATNVYAAMLKHLHAPIYWPLLIAYCNNSWGEVQIIMERSGYHALQLPCAAACRAPGGEVTTKRLFK